MGITYEEVYFSYLQLKKNSNKNYFGLIANLGVKSEILDLFQQFGILILEGDYFLFMDIDEKVSGEIPFYFYFKNKEKLNKILDENSHVKYFIHFILFNVYIYLTPEKLIQMVKKKIETDNKNNNEIFQIMNIKNEEIIKAHELLVDCSIIKKDYCLTNTYYNDNGQIIIIKDMWFYSNERVQKFFEHEYPIDYIQKILIFRCVHLL